MYPAAYQTPSRSLVDTNNNDDDDDGRTANLASRPLARRRLLSPPKLARRSHFRLDDCAEKQYDEEDYMYLASQLSSQSRLRIPMLDEEGSPDRQPPVKNSVKTSSFSSPIAVTAAIPSINLPLLPNLVSPHDDLSTVEDLLSETASEEPLPTIRLAARKRTRQSSNLPQIPARAVAGL